VRGNATPSDPGSISWAAAPTAPAPCAVARLPGRSARLTGTLSVMPRVLPSTATQRLHHQDGKPVPPRRPRYGTRADPRRPRTAALSAPLFPVRPAGQGPRSHRGAGFGQACPAGRSCFAVMTVSYRGPFGETPPGQPRLLPASAELAAAPGMAGPAGLPRRVRFAGIAAVRRAHPGCDPERLDDNRALVADSPEELRRKIEADAGASTRPGPVCPP